MATEGNLLNYDRVVADLRDIYERKNRDYGDSFNTSMQKFGIISYAVRAGDKMNRIEQLVNSAAHVKDESIRDTIKDLANYSIMALMWLDEEGIK